MQMLERSWFLPIVLTILGILSLGLALYFLYYRDPSALLSLNRNETTRDAGIRLSGPTKKIAVFFVTNDGGSLTTLEKEIPGDLTLMEQVKEAVQTLISKPPEGLITPIPEGTRLQSLFIDSLGNAYLDFSREIQQGHMGGLTAELLTVGSIVNTLLFNFKEIKGVQLLVEGSEIETLAGHIDCTKPFLQILMLENKQ